MRIKCKSRKNLINAAMGRIENDLVIENAKVVNMVNGEISEASVYIKDGFITHVAYEPCDLIAKEHYDAKGMYLTPGLIDSHVHIESSMLTPYNFANVVIPWGTTTVITDPHEIGNVMGKDGVKYMHEASKGLPMRQFIDIPSSVPSVKGGLENANATFYKEEIAELAKLERVIGLAEVMDYLAVINAEDWMLDIIETALDNDLYLQGHAPFVSGKALSAYLCGGPNTDHETRDAKEAYEKFRNGMRIDARSSSICKNINEILNGIKGTKYFDNLTFCTDDREADDILKHGQLNDVLNEAIAWGMEPIDVLKAATFNAAKEANIDKLGLIAPGYVADILLLEDLKHIDPRAVFFEGKLVAKDHELLVDIKHDSYKEESVNSVKLSDDLSVEDFVIKAPIANGKIKVNVMAYDALDSSSTHLEVKEFEVRDHEIILEDDYSFVAVLNRYGLRNIALHIVKHFGLNKGALASTVSHDSHNLTIVYKNPSDAYKCALNIKEVHGGMSAVIDGKDIYTLALPLAGLMSLKDAKELSLEAEKMKEANRQVGLEELENPLLRIVTLALPVVPEVKMSDMGLVDVNKKVFIPLFA